MGDLNLMSPEECGKQTPDLRLIKNILDNGLDYIRRFVGVM